MMSLVALLVREDRSTLASRGSRVDQPLFLQNTTSADIPGFLNVAGAVARRRAGPTLTLGIRRECDCERLRGC